MKQLWEMMGARTTVLVTHRLVGLEAMDEILVLRAGRVMERGSHHDLIQLGGLYARMWALQCQFLRA
jgi:ABC-type transport system involved in Fe-S cluster assembly fused permease/ATPase subunit